LTVVVQTAILRLLVPSPVAQQTLKLEDQALSVEVAMDMGDNTKEDTLATDKATASSPHMEVAIPMLSSKCTASSLSTANKQLLTLEMEGMTFQASHNHTVSPTWLSNTPRFNPSNLLGTSTESSLPARGQQHLW
jgi:hypothetical protein